MNISAFTERQAADRVPAVACSHILDDLSAIIMIINCLAKQDESDDACRDVRIQHCGLQRPDGELSLGAIHVTSGQFYQKPERAAHVSDLLTIVSLIKTHNLSSNCQSFPCVGSVIHTCRCATWGNDKQLKETTASELTQLSI